MYNIDVRPFSLTFHLNVDDDAHQQRGVGLSGRCGRNNRQVQDAPELPKFPLKQSLEVGLVDPIRNPDIAGFAELGAVIGHFAGIPPE